MNRTNRPHSTKCLVQEHLRARFLLCCVSNLLPLPPALCLSVFVTGFSLILYTGHIRGGAASRQVLPCLGSGLVTVTVIVIVFLAGTADPARRSCRRLEALHASPRAGRKRREQTDADVEFRAGAAGRGDFPRV